LAYLTESELHVQAKEMGLNVLHFINDKKYDTQGFIAVDDAKKQVILSFTGTVSIKDIWTDVQCSMVQFPELKIRKGPVLTSLRSLVGKETAQPTSETDESHDQRVKGCEVHAGFCRSYLSVVDFIVLSLISIYAKYSSYELHITGHSLGGALATLAAVDLHIKVLFYFLSPSFSLRLFLFPLVFLTSLLETLSFSKVCPPSISVFTVGQPRVGNRTFVQLYSEIVASSWRLVNFGDQVSIISASFVPLPLLISLRPGSQTSPSKSTLAIQTHIDSNPLRKKRQVAWLLFEPVWS
jgi:predicted lipase